MSASDQPIVMLRVEAEHDDGTYYAERKAPRLPDGVFWHAGMWYSDEIHSMKVDSIWVDEAGRVTVYFHERYRSPVSEDEKRQFSENGWTVD